MSVSGMPFWGIVPACLLMLSLAGCGGSGGGGAQLAASGAFLVSGTITAASSSAVDSDVNDPAAPFTDNSRPLANHR